MKMNFAEIERRLLKALKYGEERIPAEQLADMRQLAQIGEPGISLENFCTQLYEFDVTVPRSLKEELEAIGSAMGIKAEYWEDLEEADSSGDDR